MAEHEHKAKLRRFIAHRGAGFLADANITSIGIGRKNNAEDAPIAIIFTVALKADADELEGLQTTLIPPEIMVEGTAIPTDVQTARYDASHTIVEPQPPGFRMRRHDPVCPGISVGHSSRTSGTIGAIVFDEHTGLPCVLSNWHVLFTERGIPASDNVIGSAIYQPSWPDHDGMASNLAGMLLRGVLGEAGDGALAMLTHRTFDRTIHAFDVIPQRMADVDLGDGLVKSGRTTGVTYGIVRRVDVRLKIDLGLEAGPAIIGGFDIAPDPARPANEGEISAGGDSGALWMIHEDGHATDIVAGLHCAGELAGNADEHAIANYPLALQQALRFSFSPPA